MRHDGAVGTFVIAELMAPHEAALRLVTNEDEFLDWIDTIAELPDAGDPRWDGDDALDELARLLAAADTVGERQWRRGIAPLYARASLGDEYDHMQSIRHGPERSFRNDPAGLAAVMIPLAAHPRPGTRHWSVRELGILRELVGLSPLLVAVHDPVAVVSEEARRSIVMLAQHHDEARIALAELNRDPASGPK